MTKKSCNFTLEDGYERNSPLHHNEAGGELFEIVSLTRKFLITSRYIRTTLSSDFENTVRNCVPASSGRLVAGDGGSPKTCPFSLFPRKIS